jgi:hypothetical protein
MIGPVITADQVVKLPMATGERAERDGSMGGLDSPSLSSYL